MPNPSTFTISRIELRKIFSAYGVAERKMDEIFSSMEKSHRHVNIVQFVGLMEKAGLNRDRVINIFRRMNMNDILIEEVLNMADESRINAETGRLYKASIELG
jgi:hypothetical protein